MLRPIGSASNGTLIMQLYIKWGVATKNNRLVSTSSFPGKLCVVIAAFLIEFRHRMEPLVKRKLVEKNKAIRLAAAKKTIEELQDKTVS